VLVLHLCLSVDVGCGKKTCRVLSRLSSFNSQTKPDRGFKTSGGLVKAALVYRNDQAEALRIIGSWLDASGDHTEFRVDESHKLMVGIQYAQMFTVIGRRHVYEHSRFTIETEPHDLPAFQTVRVTLTNANTGDFLYEGEFRVTLNPLGIVPEDL
jgi:hypothetical protein